MSGEALRLLVLGGGVMQLPAVRIAAGLGWQVSVAALEVSAEVRALSRRALRVDLRDREAVEEAARRLQREEGLDGVFTAGTDFSATVAWVAERLGLPGIPCEVALKATDKARMRAAFDEAGVPSPRYYTLQAEAAGSAALPPGFAFPLVVKPVDNMGARGVRRVDCETELAAAARAAAQASRSGRVIVEQHLEGPELSLDAVVHRGRVSVCGVADRHIRFAPYFVEMGHTMPSGLDTPRLRAAEEVFIRGIRALGIHEGAAKGDVKLTPGGPVVGEIAARLSGGYMSGWTFPLSSGVEVTEAALRIAVGLPPGDLSPRRAWVSAERAFISIPGRVAALEGLEEARELPRVRELFLRAAVGQEVALPVDNLGKCGNVISAAPSRREAVEAAEAAARRVLVRLEPANERTEAYLAGRLQGEFRAFGGAIAEGLPGARGDTGEARDWHGCTLREAAARVAELTGERAEEVVPAAILRRALERGSVQAGVYVIDSLRRAGGAARELLRRWEAWP